MARLDKFIQVMHEHRAEALTLVSGQPVSLVMRGAARPLTKDALSDVQILGLIREIAPPEVQPLVTPTAQISFAYDAPTGGIDVAVEPGVDGAGVTLRPSTGAAAAGNGAASSAARPAAPSATAVPAPPDAAVREAMENLLRRLAGSGASDLHLRSGEPPIFRRSGELTRDDAPAIPGERLEEMLVAIMGPRDLAEYREAGDVDWAYEIGGVSRYRCNAGRDRHGPFAVVRVIPTLLQTADDLGISREVQNLCYLTKGLVVVTGPTGSGKSTTLAAMIDLMNRTRADHILTIEDPIEFVHPSKQCVVTQRQVGVHTKSFRNALRAALREDPDIVLVGEMRDLETVSIAIETAETGHLVFGTLHTTTAASTIDRIIDQFPSDRQSQIRVMLSESLRGVIAQTLCRKVGGGRVAAREVLLSIPAISNLIREGKTFQIPSIIQTNRKHGMIALNDALMELVENGLVEPKEAYMKAADKPGMAASLKAKRHDTSFLGEA